MKKHFFSGIQPSGRLHIGNYFGAIRQWIELQERYEPVFGIVDFHGMTARYDPKDMPVRVLDAAASYLAAGLDPEKGIIMLQSLVQEHVELAWILNCITPMGRLSRVPTFKDKVRQHPDNVNMGLFGYPVLMAADILLYKSEIVPVGEDQVPHLELTREIARKFNSVFGDTFPEPAEVLSTGAKILGTDGVGRSTQIALLREWLEAEGYAVSETGLKRSKLAGKGLKDAMRGQQNEQEPGQLHLSRRRGRRHHEEARVRYDRPGEEAPRRPRRPRGVQHLQLPPRVLHEGGAGLLRRGLSHSGDRLRRVQEDSGRAHPGDRCAHQGAPEGAAGETGRHARSPQERLGPCAPDRAGDDE